ncbi:MAG: hypothetical protein JWO13_392 [Acidobacteriales bacterium]|nr:hypothetical protein [Terriglobales bacterium]
MSNMKSRVVVFAVFLTAIYCGAEDDQKIQTITKIDAKTPRELQIRLARSAAPPEVSDHADIYVLGNKGNELAIKGRNGFSCLIARQHTDTLRPECFDRVGSDSTLKSKLFTESERAKGKTDA